MSDNSARRGGTGDPLWLRRSPTYLGVVIVIAGLALLLVSWIGVSGEAQVHLQLPYLVSGGLTGLSLVMLGSLIINVATRRAEVAAQLRELRKLQEIALSAAHQKGTDGEATGQ
ncbi:MAG: hypothetical protein ACI867_000290 [Glaciecola sp.]|jgi:hypothetical protein